MSSARNNAEYVLDDTVDRRFTVKEIIGWGGAGHVYRVLDEKSERIFALKSYSADVIPAHVQPKQLKNLLDPLIPDVEGICRPYHFGEHRGRKYITWALVWGASLRLLISERRLSRKNFSIQEAASILSALVHILADLPSSTVHGNIKPENIILMGLDRNRPDEKLTVHNTKAALTDFGQIRVITFSKFAALQLNQGAPYAYLSPEHISLGGRVDQRADIYAAGVMFYELLSGRLPQKIYKPVAELVPEVPPQVDKFLSRLLNADPARRPGSWNVLLDELAAIIELEVPDAEPIPALTPDRPLSNGGFNPDDILTENIERTLDALAYPDAARTFREQAGNGFNMPTPDRPVIIASEVVGGAPHREDMSEAGEPIFEPETVPDNGQDDNRDDRVVQALNEPPDVQKPAAQEPAAPEPMAEEIPEPELPEPPAPVPVPEPEPEPEPRTVRKVSASPKPNLPTPPEPTPKKFDLQEEILSDRKKDLESWIRSVEKPGGKKGAKARPPGPIRPPAVPAPEYPASGQHGSMFKKIPATNQEFFAGTGVDPLAPKAASRWPGSSLSAGQMRQSKDAASKFGGFDPIGQAIPSTIRPEINDNDQELVALNKMLEEAEDEADRREEAGRLRTSQTKVSVSPESAVGIPGAMIPPSKPLVIEGKDAFPPLESDSSFEEQEEQEEQDDEFSRKFGRKKKPKAPKKISRPRRKRSGGSGSSSGSGSGSGSESEISPLRRVFTVMVLLLLLAVGTLIIYHFKMRTEPTGTENTQANEADVLDFLRDLPDKDDGKNGAEANGTVQVGQNPDMDPELAEILEWPSGMTSDKTVKELTADAEKLLETNQYFEPEAPDNAVWVLQQILKKDAKNSFAALKLAEIGEKYEKLAQMEIKKKRLEKAQSYMEKAVIAQPDKKEYQILLADLKRSVAGGAQELSCPKSMLFVAAGPFFYGSAKDDPGRLYGEAALMEYYLPAFCIDIFEYPNKQGEIPESKVTYFQARLLCEEQGKRLCSEEEWEKSCKGAKNLRYPYGNEFDPSVCNTEDLEGKDRSLAPTGEWEKCRTSEGLFDMSGNLKEWTASLWASGLQDYSVRGGGYRSPEKASRCMVREANNPQIKNSIIGFRCCKTMGMKKNIGEK